MITEKGTVKVSSQLNMQAQKELNKTSTVLSIIYIVLGGILLIPGIALTVAEDGEVHPLICLAAILIVLGIIVLVAVNGTNKAAMKYNKVEEVEFFRDHLIVREYADGEHISTAKVYYKCLLRVKETKNYLFMYNTRSTAVMVEKKNLPFQELNAVRNLIGKPSKSPNVGQPYNGNAGGNISGNVNGNTGGNAGGTVNNGNVNNGAGSTGVNGSTVTPPWAASDMPAGQQPSDPFADLSSSEPNDGDGSDN